jgi:hypothetical protein
MDKVTIDRAALEALLKTVAPMPDGSSAALARELNLAELATEAATVSTRRQGRSRKRGIEPIDPLDQLATIVLCVPETMNRQLKTEVAAANTNMTVYLRAILHVAQRAGMFEHVTAALRENIAAHKKKPATA